MEVEGSPHCFGRMSQVEQGVGAALAVLFRTAGAGEAHAFVEGESTFILFVDVGGHSRVESEAVAYERAADAFAVPGGVDEEGLHMRAFYQHEADRPVIGVGRQPCGGVGQEAGHFFIERSAIGWIEEIMGGVDGGAPDVEQAGAVGGAGGADRCHGLTYRDEVAQAKRRGVGKS